MFFPRRRFQPLTDEKRSFERRRAQRITSEIPPELSNLMNQVLAIERIGPLRRGDFVLRTTSLHGWTAADAKHLHHTIFINTANSVCRGAGDSHLPRSMRARNPHVLSPVGGSTANGRGTKFREPTEQRMTTGDSAGALELDTSSSRHRAVWTAPAGISCYARPTYAVGSRQMQSPCTRN